MEDTSLSEAFLGVIPSSVVCDETLVAVSSSSPLLCSSLLESSRAMFESNLCGGGGGCGGGGSTPPPPGDEAMTTNLMHIKSVHKCSCCLLLDKAIFIILL